jgi:lipopolysaccharide/colanic/teichoic acid biosynthesis glycosyltransferase
MIVNKKHPSSAFAQAPQDYVLSGWLTQYIRRYIPGANRARILLADPAGGPSMVEIATGDSYYPEPEATVLVDPSPLNSCRYVNKHLEAVNAQLHLDDYLVGCLETAEQRQERLRSKWPGFFGSLFLLVDYLIMRVWPKLPYLRRLYFGLTGGRYRVLSEMETYGRLYSCGFQLVDAQLRKGMTFFIARKTGRPDFNEKASYGPLIKLPRQGLGGKLIHVYKLRTMAPYSEYIQEFVFERYGLESGGKIRNDPRINHLGHFLRRYWIDEIPMLINLLKGDLKLFGVRPLSRHYLSLYSEDFQRYRRGFKPGLIPPCYVDLPQTLDEIIASEERYLRAYERRPWRTDLEYLWRFLKNLLFKKVRSS